MASPFTSRLPSPAACVEILRQGRCTLVVTQQVYRILAVNCLILSYTLSVLHLHGVRNGDSQATIAGMAMTAFFLTVSWARPMKALAPVHPHTTVFHPALLLSVLGQFLVHLAALAFVVRLCTPFAAADASATAAATAAAANETAAIAAGLIPPPPPEEDILGMLFGSSSGGDTAAEAAADTGGGGGLLGLLLGTGSDGLPLSAPRTTAAVASVTSLAAAVAEATATATAVAVDAADAAMAALMRTRPAALSVAAAAPAASGAVAAAMNATAAPVYFEDQKFAPNIINTAVFLLSTSQQACTFLLNYAGAPFMQVRGHASRARPVLPLFFARIPPCSLPSHRCQRRL